MLVFNMLMAHRGGLQMFLQLKYNRMLIEMIHRTDAVTGRTLLKLIRKQQLSLCIS
jgi:hypothetical protein